jgi:hypothetical protein
MWGIGTFRFEREPKVIQLSLNFCWKTEPDIAPPGLGE